jgi:hypothetical protein
MREKRRSLTEETGKGRKKRLKGWESQSKPEMVNG